MRVTEPYTIFPRKLQSGKIIYYYQFRDENNHRSPAYSTGTSNKAQAKRICQKMYNEGLFQTSSRLFKNFAAGFFDDNSAYIKYKIATGENLTPSTIMAYKRLLNNQIMPYFEKMEISKITVDTVKNWIVWLTDKWSAKTSNNAQTVFNIIMKSAKEKRLIKEVPSADLSFRKVKRKERELLTIQELNQIYHSDLWNWEVARRAFLICAITGMRIGEVTGLQTVDVENDRLNVRHSLHPTFGLGTTKTKTCRYVPVPPIIQLKEKCGAIWAFEKPTSSDPINEKYVYKRFVIVLDSLGIDHKTRGITIHSLRNLFISYMRGSSFGETIDLKIKAVVGHSDNTQTDWYTYWKPEMFPEIYQIQEKLYKEIIK